MSTIHPIKFLVMLHGKEIYFRYGPLQSLILNDFSHRREGVEMKKIGGIFEKEGRGLIYYFEAA